MGGEMIERVGRVLATGLLRRYDMVGDKMVDCTWEQVDPLWRKMYLRKARAVIEAMREPTEAMLDASANAARGMTFSDYPRKTDAALYRAMIAAALGSEPQPRAPLNRGEGSRETP